MVFERTLGCQMYESIVIINEYSELVRDCTKEPSTKR
jgi:hypothetical protein